MSDIFICYARKDIDTAMRVVQLFEAEGWRVFIDKQTLVGRRWHKEIEKELHAARAVVVLWSSMSRDSDFVLEEAEFGKHKKILFPVFIESVEFPYGFSRIQTANLVNWDGSLSHPDCAALLQSLRLHLNGREQISIAPELSEPVQSFASSPATTPTLQDGISDGKKTDSKKPTMRKFLLPAALVLLAIIIFPVAESLYQDFIQPSPVVTPDMETASVEAAEEKTAPIQQEVKASQNQPSPLLDRKLLPELVYIPAGSFHMGEQDKTFIKILDSNQKQSFGLPGKYIEISKPFYLGKTEVTYAQYEYYAQQQQIIPLSEEKPITSTGSRDNQPIVSINWRQAMAYAQWLGNRTKNQCRLPTEAEWEYAARAGMRTAYPWGNEVGNNNANCDGCGSQWDKKQSAPVTSFAPNSFGLYDMSGNVWEWTCSNWRDQFDGSEQQCNDDVSDASLRAVRGGSWGNDANDLRSSARTNIHPGYRYDRVGFRVQCLSPIIPYH